MILFYYLILCIACLDLLFKLALRVTTFFYEIGISQPILFSLSQNQIAERNSKYYKN